MMMAVRMLVLMLMTMLMMLMLMMPLTLLEPQPRFGDKPVKFQVGCAQIGTAVLKGLSDAVCMPLKL